MPHPYCLRRLHRNINAGYVKRAVAATGSHFASAERQYRYPLELGCTRPPQAYINIFFLQSALFYCKRYCRGQHFTFRLFTGTDADDYDLILTGDLGALGSRILKDLTWEKGYDISPKHVDCGEMVYKVIEKEFQGGSGAAARLPVIAEKKPFSAPFIAPCASR